MQSFGGAQAEALADKRIVVAIDSWEADSAYPAGHYVRTLGPIGDRETETEVGALRSLLRCTVGCHARIRCTRICRMNRVSMVRKAVSSH